MKLDHLLQSQEGKCLEFKRDLSSPANIMKTLVAFANTAGGVMLVGVDDDHTVVGIPGNPLDEEERLSNMIADSITPRLIPNIELLPSNNLTLLAVEVFPSQLRPHHLKQKGEQQEVFARTFRELDLIEQWGTGIRRIFQEAKQQGLPKPEIIEIGMRIRMTIFLAEAHKIAPPNNRHKSDATIGGVNDLLEFIRSNPGRKTSDFKTALKRSQRTIERWLKQLKDFRKIEFRGSPKTGGYFVTHDEK